MIGLIGSILSLVILIFQEYFSQKAKSQAADQKWQMDQTTFQGIVNTALQKQALKMAQDSAGAASGWDAADADKIKADKSHE